MSGELLGYKLIGLRQAIDSLELEFAQTAAEFARTNEYDEQGSTSPIDWIRHSCHMTSTTAAACLAVGRNLERLPESVQAMKSGEVGFAHLTVMARTMNAVPDRFQEGRLLEQARESSPGSSTTSVAISATRPTRRVMPPSRPSKSSTAAST